MAVAVQCYHCSTVLELDEGFRGGVCRCSQCGSLLQVPKNSSHDVQRAARPASPDGPGRPARPGNPLEDPGLSRGQLDARSPGASAVGSSGALSRSPGHRPAGPPAAARAAAPVTKKPGVDANLRPAGKKGGKPGEKKKSKDKTLFYVIIGGAVVLLVLGIFVVVLVWKMSSGKSRTGAAPSGEAANARVSPRILGVPLEAKRVLFSLDDATSTINSFTFITHAVQRAVNSLRPKQQFCVALWTGQGAEFFPKHGWAHKSAAKRLFRNVENTQAGGATNVRQAMVASMKKGAGQTIFITAKNFFAPGLVKAMKKARKSGQRVDAIYIHRTSVPTPLARIAANSNGMFLRLTKGQLERRTAGQ